MTYDGEYVFSTGPAYLGTLQRMNRTGSFGDWFGN